MRALFLASYVPEAAAIMRGWLASGNEIAAVWSPQMRSSGLRDRDRRLGFLAPRWSVSRTAGRAGAEISIVPRLSTWAGRFDALAKTGADVLISVYFPFVVPPDMIDAFAGRAVNFHPAPLPRYRGPAPFHAMIIDRSIEREGAMTLHVMAAGLDEGDIIAAEPVAYPENNCMVRYRLRAARAGERLAREQLPAFLDGRIAAVKQDEAQATYVRLADLDMSISADLDAAEIRRRCDAFSTFPALLLRGAKHIKIVGFGGVLGPPTGAPQVHGAITVEMDCRDARIWLKRKRPWSGQLRRVRTMAIHVLEPAN